ncbi:MAG TPA: hemolysin family protein, partial [Verrucomicrobiae bacterium]|nr:hemolysin family protein [Verrucomicrobiae bacterium]
MNSDLLLTIGLKVLAVLVLVFLNGFFVATEFALVKIRDTQLDPLIAKGNRRAKVARNIIHNLDAYLSATQLGITLASLGLGWIGEPIFEDILHPLFEWLHVESRTLRQSVAVGMGFATITFLHIVAGEQAPKTYGIREPLRTTLFVAYPMKWFYSVAYPFIWLLNESSLWLLRAFGIEPADEHHGAQSEDELRLMLTSAHARGGGTALGRTIVVNALELRRRRARDVMRPRNEILTLDTQASIAACLEVAEKTRYSRFPLCEGGNLDKTLGVVHIKDLFALRGKAKTGADLRAVVRKLVYVPETARLEKLLQVLLERKLHLAIVVDEYGGTVGLVTLENILEELVGQIQDEFDQEKPMIVRLDGDVWDIMGQLPLHDLADVVGEPLREEGISTVSGFVTHRLGGFPHEGQKIQLGDFELTVEEMDGPLVARLRLTRRAPEP